MNSILSSCPVITFSWPKVCGNIPVFHLLLVEHFHMSCLGHDRAFSHLHQTFNSPPCFLAPGILHQAELRGRSFGLLDRTPSLSLSLFLPNSPPLGSLWPGPPPLFAFKCWSSRNSLLRSSLFFPAFFPKPLHPHPNTAYAQIALTMHLQPKSSASVSKVPNICHPQSSTEWEVVSIISTILSPVPCIWLPLVFLSSSPCHCPNPSQVLSSPTWKRLLASSVHAIPVYRGTLMYVMNVSPQIYLGASYCSQGKCSQSPTRPALSHLQLHHEALPHSPLGLPPQPLYFTQWAILLAALGLYRRCSPPWSTFPDIWGNDCHPSACHPDLSSGLPSIWWLLC